jgi:hypothetical protein
MVLQDDRCHRPPPLALLYSVEDVFGFDSARIA